MTGEVAETFKLGAHALGHYHLGLLYSETVFDRVTVLGFNYPDVPIDDLLTSAISHHEALHGMQDVSSGFAAAVNEVMRLRDERCVEYFRENPARMHFVPLKRSGDTSARRMTAWYELMDSLRGALLADSEGGLSATAVIEGAAAVYTEVYKRWHSLAECGLTEFADIYDFVEVGTNVMRMPELYRTAFRFYLAHAPVPTSAGEHCALLNTFLAICDWSLQVPPIDPEAVRKAGDISRFLPGDRFVAAVTELAKRRVFWAPLKLPVPALVSAAGNPEVTDRRSIAGTFVHEKLHSAYPANDGNIARWCDDLSLKTGHFRVTEACSAWIEFFDDQLKRAQREKVIALRRQCMIDRRSSPLLLGSFPAIRNEIIGHRAPIFCRTRNGMYYVGDVEKQEQFEAVVTVRLFLDGVCRQLVHSGLRTCPFANKTMIACAIEDQNCRGSLNSRDAKYSSCSLGKMFETLFHARVADCASAAIKW